MKTKIFATVALSFCFVYALALEGGEDVFKNRCMACHRVDADFAGPALANVDQRRSTEWLVKFIHSPQAMISSGDTAAKSLAARFSIVMPDHADLTEEQIKSVIDYIKSESSNVKPKDAKPFDRPAELPSSYQPFEYNNIMRFATYIIIVMTLAGVLLFSVRVKEISRKDRPDV